MAQIGKPLSTATLSDPSRRRFFRLGTAVLLATSTLLITKKDARALGEHYFSPKKDKKPEDKPSSKPSANKMPSNSTGVTDFIVAAITLVPVVASIILALFTFVDGPYEKKSPK